MQYLNLALRAVEPGRGDSTSDLRDNRPVKRDSRGSSRAPDTFRVPFGLNLTAVQPEHDPARTQTEKNQPSRPLTQSGPLDHSDEGAVTTNDLLDCLVHPDVIARVTELLLERHARKSRNAPF